MTEVSVKVLVVEDDADIRRFIRLSLESAGYEVFDGAAPDAPLPHGAIAAEYAHVTAPLRRLVDRFGLEICLAHSQGTEVPEHVRAALPTLPETMATATRSLMLPSGLPDSILASNSAPVFRRCSRTSGV